MMIITRRSILRGAMAAPLVLMRRPALAAPPSLIFRRGFGYPGGILRPGFNPNHPASAGMAPRHGISAVPSGGSFVNLLNGSIGVNSADITPTVSSVAGPGLFYNFGNTGTSFTGQAMVTDANATLAVIVASSGFFTDGIFQNCSAAVTTGYQIAYAGSGGAQFFGFINNSQRTGNFPQLLLGVPYFLAFSSNPTESLFVQTNLTNGQTFYATDSPATPGASDGTYLLGNGYGGNNELIGTLYAAMYSPVALTLTQLRMWAADPWSFWYPTTMAVAGFDAELVGHTGSVAPSASFMSLPMMGVGP